LPISARPTRSNRACPPEVLSGPILVLGASSYFCHSALDWQATTRSLPVQKVRRALVILPMRSAKRCEAGSESPVTSVRRATGFELPRRDLHVLRILPNCQAWRFAFAEGSQGQCFALGSPVPSPSHSMHSLWASGVSFASGPRSTAAGSSRRKWFEAPQRDSWCLPELQGCQTRHSVFGVPLPEAVYCLWQPGSLAPSDRSVQDQSLTHPLHSGAVSCRSSGPSARPGLSCTPADSSDLESPRRDCRTARSRSISWRCPSRRHWIRPPCPPGSTSRPARWHRTDGSEPPSAVKSICQDAIDPEAVCNSSHRPPNSGTPNAIHRV
jgi:hypothetical protein